MGRKFLTGSSNPRAAHSAHKKVSNERHLSGTREWKQQAAASFKKSCMIAADAAGSQGRAGGEAGPSGASFMSDVVERRVRKGCIDEVLLFAMLFAMLLTPSSNRRPA